MNPIYSRFNKKKYCKTRIEVFYSYVLVIFLLGAYNAIAQSNQKFIQGNDTLIVYKDVPGLTPSEFYTIRVRSAATNNEWVECFANITRNLAFQQTSDKQDNKETAKHYQKFTDRWSQSYGNIEMSPNLLVEVEITAKNGFKIDGKEFYKATVHPSHKASLAKIIGGKVFFTINQPSQITIDINGQMDDFNAAINPIGSPVHTISLFANPIMDKPLNDDPGVVIVNSGQKPPTNPTTYKTLYFGPGIHDLGRGFKVHPGKNYYIPGDAMVYGTFNNIDVSQGKALCVGENIRIYGVGTLSGDRLTHPNYDNPENIDMKEFKAIAIENALNVEVKGICIANAAHPALNANAWGGRPDKTQNTTIARWVKVISWRSNGDGIGGLNLVEDCFLRTADDGTYVKGNRIRCTFWKDANAAAFHMAEIPDGADKFPILVSDCDVLYNRSRSDIAGSGIFVQRARSGKGQHMVDVTFQDIRIHDKNPNAPIFKLIAEFDDSFLHVPARQSRAGASYSGIIFKNITAAAAYDRKGDGKTEYILGAADSRWDGGVIFDNVRINGLKLTNLNHFKVNEFVSNIIFK